MRQVVLTLATMCLLALPLNSRAGIDDVSPEELARLIAEGTGIAPTMKLSGALQGSTIILTRLTRTGQAATNGIGICFSTTNPEPTVLDNYTTTTYSNNGTIYALEGLTPATVYYIRAFGIGTNWKVGYSKPIKLYTLPKASVSFTYGYEGDAAINARITAAAQGAVDAWNATTAIQDWNTDIHYASGTPTADCSYGGYMRVGPNESYQATGTILHEMCHGIGVGTHWHWTNSDIYRENTSRGIWQGDRVERVMHFVENSNTATLTGDVTHMWPYGINGAHEDTHQQIHYWIHGFICEALGEDFLPYRNWRFATPAYTFEQDDTLKYYIKNADEDRGLRTSYLRETNTKLLRWHEGLSDDILANDSFAWHVTFDPHTCYYTFTNVGTGNTLIWNGTNFRTTASAKNGQQQIQLLGARESTKVGTYTFVTKAYWMVEPEGSKAMNANTNTVVAAANFDHANSASQQRWFIMTADEVSKFGRRIGDKTVGINPTAAEADSDLQLMVRGGKGFAAITAQDGNATVSVVTLGGQTLQHLYVTRGTTATVPLPRGIYIIGGRKVAVQ